MLCRNIQYIERDAKEHYHTIRHFPDDLNKKVTLLKYFRNYMSEHLLKVQQLPFDAFCVMSILCFVSYMYFRLKRDRAYITSGLAKAHIVVLTCRGLA